MDTIEIPLCALNGSRIALPKSKCIRVPNQDYIFAAIVKAGPLMSRLDTETYQEIYDMQDQDGLSLLFSMNVLEMSKLKETQTSIDQAGLAAWWKLQRQEHKEGHRAPTIVFQEVISNIDSSLFQSLTHSKSADFARSRQMRIWEDQQKSCPQKDPQKELKPMDDA